MININENKQIKKNKKNSKVEMKIGYHHQQSQYNKK